MGYQLVTSLKVHLKKFLNGIIECKLSKRIIITQVEFFMAKTIKKKS